MSKAQKIATALNSQSHADARQAAEKLAASLGVTLYWLGTASNYNGLPHAQVMMANGRKIGEVVLSHDGQWRSG